MSNVVLTVTRVTDNAAIPKKDGSTYMGLFIEGVTSNGKQFTRGIHPNGFKSRPGLKEKLLALSSGQTATLVLDDSGFKNITDVLEGAVPSPSKGRSGGGFSSNKREQNIHDTARIARATAVQAVATAGFAKNVNDLTNAATVVAEFLMAPLGVDSFGKAVSIEASNEVVDDEDDLSF